jgi:hypothetical protein
MPQTLWFVFYMKLSIKLVWFKMLPLESHIVCLSSPSNDKMPAKNYIHLPLFGTSNQNYSHWKIATLANWTKSPTERKGRSLHTNTPPHVYAIVFWSLDVRSGNWGGPHFFYCFCWVLNPEPFFLRAMNPEPLVSSCMHLTSSPISPNWERVGHYTLKVMSQTLWYSKNYSHFPLQ